MAKSLHRDNFISYIKKKNNWNDQAFNAHVFSCPSETLTEHRTSVFQELQKNLKSINTSPEVVEAFTHGFQMLRNKLIDPGMLVHALTAGSLKGTDMLLTMAFHEQFHIIGWQHMFQGRLSKLWGKAVSEICKIKLPSFSTTWLAQTILYLWNYTQSYGHIEIR
jgi:hypothetical protein